MSGNSRCTSCRVSRDGQITWDFPISCGCALRLDAHLGRLIHQSEGAHVIGLFKTMQLAEPAAFRKQTRMGTAGPMQKVHDDVEGCCSWKPHFVKPLPSMRTTIKQLGSNGSCSS